MRAPASAVLRRLNTRQGLIWALLALVVVASLSLAYYGLRYAQALARGGERLMMETNRELAEGIRKRIEQLIGDSDRTVFELIDVRNLQKFPSRWSDVVRLSPSVESAIILDADLAIVPDGFVSKKRSEEEVDAFRKLFEEDIAPRLRLGDLRSSEVRHLHGEFGGRTRLLSYTRRWVGGVPYTLVLESDLAYLVGEVFPDSFAGVDTRRLYQVVDEDRRPVFGYPFASVPERYVAEVPFGTTLERWSIRMAPRDALVLAAQARWRSGGMVGLILLSTVTVTVGLLLLLALALGAERRATAMKSDFVANVSHELKTPLSLIRMFGEMLSTGRAQDPVRAQDYAVIITRESERLTHLIDNVLDFARIERGKAAYDRKPASWGQVVVRALEIASSRLEQAGMQLEAEIAPDLPDVVIDESAMTLAVLNLVDNAVKYAASGKTVRVTLAAEPGRQVLTVADEGPGFDPGESRRVFERFYRTESARKQGIRGSGIGLALVEHIAVAHGGQVSVDAAPGQGARFSLWVPA